jgi:predicted nucleic acid-binding protein
MIIFIDTGVLGLITSPNENLEVRKCQNWLYQLIARGVYAISSEICDYELRRSLILESFTTNNQRSRDNLNYLNSLIDFFPVSTEVLQKAAELWAQARRQGIPTADRKNIDADMIIAATSQLVQTQYPGRNLLVATTNVKHIDSFIAAKTWEDIRF